MNTTNLTKLKQLSVLFLGRDVSDFQYTQELFAERLRFAGLIKNTNFRSIIIPPALFPYYIDHDEILQKQMETWVRFESPVSIESAEQYLKVREFYDKWLEAEKEQDIFRAASAIKEAYKNNPDTRNFPLMMLFAFFFVFEGRNSRTAIDLMQICKRELDNQRVDSELRRTLNYFLEILFGLYYYREGDYSYAVIKFLGALDLNPSGLEAKYLAAQCYLKSGNAGNAATLVKEILLFDLERISHIIEKGNPILFEYFYRNPDITNLLSSDIFGEVADILENAILSFSSYRTITPEIIRKKLSELEKLEMEDIYIPGVANTLEFIENALAQYKNENSLYYRISVFYMHERLLQILNLTSTLIRTNYEKFVERRIEKSENDIITVRKEIENLEEKIVREKGKTAEGLDKALLDLSIHTRDMVDYNLEQLNKIENDSKINPFRILRRTFISGVALSAGLTVLNYFVSPANSDSSQSVRMASSIKLGILSLIICAVVSVIIFGISFFEQKRRIKKINNKIEELNAAQVSEG
ncbi:MAG: hypothetical protein ACM3Q2_06175, partial [Syntrophothermus sp.]